MRALSAGVAPALPARVEENSNNDAGWAGRGFRSVYTDWRSRSFKKLPTFGEHGGNGAQIAGTYPARGPGTPGEL